ncbi:MAG: ABC transporter permease subunit [Trueperaceae bacterium]
MTTAPMTGAPTTASPKTAAPMTVWSHVLREHRRALVGWSLAVAAVTAIYVSVYPSFGGGAMDDMIANLPDAMVQALGYDEMSSPGGYLTSTVFALLAPILLIIYGVSLGTRLIAGEEEDGTLELELAAPVTRAALYRERLFALWTGLVLLSAVVGLTTVLLVAVLDIEVGPVLVAAGTVGLLLLVAGFATVALAVGAWTGRRAYALAAGAGLAAAAFVLNGVAPLVDSNWMRAVSPFAWFLDAEPLIEGFVASSLLPLAAVPLVAAVLGAVRFVRRDVLV